MSVNTRSFSIAVILLLTSGSNAAFQIINSDATASKNGIASALSASEFADTDSYPRNGESGINIGETSAGTSDGASAQAIDDQVLGSLREGGSSVGGSSTAALVGGANSLVGVLQSVSGSAVTGAGNGAATNAIPTWLYQFNINHSADAEVTALGVNNGPFNVRLVGMMYVAVEGGCVKISSAGVSASCSVMAEATATIEGHVLAVNELSEQTLLFETFEVVVADPNAGINVATFANTGILGYSRFDGSSANSTSDMAGSAVSVAAAYAWYIPDPINPLTVSYTHLTLPTICSV